MSSKLDQDGWPVTTQEPYDLVTELGLPPGPALLACSGSDIVLSRGASAKPSVAKQKGRYVIMLPGILSLRPKSKESADAGADKTGEDEDERDGTTDGATDEVQADVATKSKAPITSTLLGRIEGLSTDTPVLKIPYPNGGCLTFQGHKVNDSTSRFMMLSFKKGDVICKDAVSSVIVFGESTYSGPKCTDLVELDELTHYGGSDRTIDGGKAVKVKKGTRPVVKTARLTQLTTDIPSQTIRDPVRITSKAKVLITTDVDDDEDDSDAYLDDTQDVRSNQTLGSARRSSRRIASSKVSYAVDEDEDDGDHGVEDDEQSSDADDEKANSKKVARKRTPSKPKAVHGSDSDKEEEEKFSKSTRKRAPAKPMPVLGSESDNEEEEKPSKPIRKRAPAKQKPMLDSDSDQEEVEKPSKSARKRAPAKLKPVIGNDADKEEEKKPSMPAKKRAPANPNPVLDLDSDYEKEEEKTSKPARKRATSKPKPLLALDSDKEKEEKPSKLARKRAPAKAKPVLDSDCDKEQAEKSSKSTRKRAAAKSQVVLDVDDSDDVAAANPVMKPIGKRGTRKSMSAVDLQDDEFEPSSRQRSVHRLTSKKSKLEGAVYLDDSESDDDRPQGKSSKQASHQPREVLTGGNGRGSAGDGKGSSSASNALPMKRKVETVVIDIDERIGNKVSSVNAENVSASLARKLVVTSKANGKAIGSGNDYSDDDGSDEDYTQECNTLSAKKKAPTTRQALFTIVDVDESPNKEPNGNIGNDDGVKENEPPRKRNRTTLTRSSEKSSVLADESRSSGSKSLVIASPRSRRRRKPGGVPTSQESPKPQLDNIKSNPDDEYGTFDFSADDIAVLSTPEKRIRVKARS